MSHLPKIFSALSDPTRFAIVERLMAEGELPVADIRVGSAISAPAMSRHLNVLTEAGVVTRRAKAQQRLYAVRPQAIQTINDWTLNHRRFWELSLDRLEAALMQEVNRK